MRNVYLELLFKCLLLVRYEKGMKRGSLVGIVLHGLKDAFFLLISCRNMPVSYSILYDCHLPSEISIFITMVTMFANLHFRN